jgi:alpha-1,6-mannosyltransferase
VTQRRVLLAGWISLTAYIGIAILSWTGMVYRPNWITTTLLIPPLAAIAISYFRAIHHTTVVTRNVTLKFAIAFSVVGFFALPFDSTDVFFYMATGWEQARYDANPYTHTLREIPNYASDAMIDSKWMAQNGNPWLDLPLPYGFLFATVSRSLAWLGLGNWWATLGLFDALNLAAHTMIAILLWKISKLLPGGNPERALLLYTWNPLVITQFLANGHNDILMGFFIVLAAYFLVSRRPELVLPALVAGGLIKFLAFALVPLAAVAVARMYGRRAILLGTTLSLVIAGVVAVPYFRDPAPFMTPVIAGQIFESSGSLHRFLDVAFIRPASTAWTPLQQILPDVLLGVRAVLWLMFGAFAVGQLWKILKQPLTVDSVIQQWVALLAFALFVASPLLHSWYLGALLPLAILADKTWIGQALIASSTVYLVSFTSLRRKMFVFLVGAIVPFAVYGKRYRKLRLTTASER